MVALGKSDNVITEGSAPPPASGVDIYDIQYTTNTSSSSTITMVHKYIPGVTERWHTFLTMIMGLELGFMCILMTIF